MKKVLLSVGAVLAMVVTSQAQTNSPTLPGLSSSTNWVAIPYGIYDTTDKKWGWGVAGLYKVSDNFYTGLRYDQVNGHDNTAGVQAQLQATVTYAGIKVTPFVSASTGIGSSQSLYGSAGAGAYVSLVQKGFKISNHDFTIDAGIVGDYEHVVQTGNKNENWSQIVGGPLLSLSF
jgi:long-subunit fatty acid transport protein